MAVRFDTRAFVSRARRITAAAERFAEAAEHALLVTGATAQAVARKAAPVNTGVLANSILMAGPVAVEVGPLAIRRVEVFSTQPYAVVMEEGRRPGARRPPIEPIRRWVHLKARRGEMDVSPGEEDSVAFVIQRSIARKGIKGRKFFRKARLVAEPILRTRIRAALDQLMGEF